MTLATDIAELARSIVERSHDHRVLDEVQTSFLDTVGCIVVGSTFESSRLLAASPVHDTRGALEVSMPGLAGKRSILDAAMIVGTCAHVADFDDVSWAMMGHPSASLVPALLVLGEGMGLSGREVSAAYVVGYETMIGLGKALAPDHYLRGWHATATLGPIGVAAAAATVLDLDEPQFVNAIGIAASQSGGLRQNFGSMVKGLHVGMAVRNGLQSALLARDGFTADGEALEGEAGFLRAFAAASGSAVFPHDAGEYALVHPGTLRKQYPSCGATHQAIDAARIIRQRNQVDPDQIESITVSVAPVCFAPLLPRRPVTPLEGKFSMEFCVATALVHGKVSLEQFSTSALDDRRVQALMAKVTMVSSADLADNRLNSNRASAAEVEVRFCDDRHDSVLVQVPEGEPSNPLSAEALAQKFNDSVTPVLGPEPAERVLGMLRRLDAVDDMRMVADLLSLPALKTPMDDRRNEDHEHERGRGRAAGGPASR
jgi:2-methylcitrate dehydratase PrpD